MKIKNTFVNKYGYRVNRYGKNYVGSHREVALKIYNSNRKKYPLSFSEYEIHHINGNTTDNRKKNLKTVTKEEHDKIHGRLCK